MADAKRIGFDDVEYGDELPETVADISLATVRVFTDAAGMSFSRFTDHEEARKSGLPGAIVPGIMSQGIFAAAIHAWLPGSKVKKLDTIFRAPVVVDTRMLVNGVVTDSNEESREIELDLTMENEAGETPVLGTAIVTLD